MKLIWKIFNYLNIVASFYIAYTLAFYQVAVDSVYMYFLSVIFLLIGITDVSKTIRGITNNDTSNDVDDKIEVFTSDYNTRVEINGVEAKTIKTNFKIVKTK